MAKKLPSHIYKTSRGNYRVRYRKSSKYPLDFDETFDNLDDAIRANDEYLGKVKLKIINKSSKPDIKFADFCDFVYDWYKNKPKKTSQNTLRFYRQYMNLLKLHFGNVNLRDITTIMIEDFLIKENNRPKMGNNSKPGEVISSMTLHHEYVALRMILNKAKKWKYIEDNPIDDVEEPEFTEKEIVVPAFEKMDEIERKIMKAPIDQRIKFLLAFYGGLREEETCGLHIDWFDREKKVVNIGTVIVQDDETKEFIEDKPKSKYSIRTIPLPDRFFDVLDEYLIFRDEQIEYLKRKTNGQYKEIPNLFLNKDGEFFRPMTLGHQWIKFRKKEDISLTYHGLRHYYLTNQMNYNDNLTARDVQELAGHSNIKTTYKYVHSDKNKIIKNATNIYNKFSREDLYKDGDDIMTLPITHIATIILGNQKYSKSDELQITLTELSKENVDLFNISTIMDKCKNYLFSNYPSLMRIEKYKYTKLNEEEIIDKITKEFGKSFKIEFNKEASMEI